MLVDSHCHLDFPGLRERLPDVLAKMRENGVGMALCVAVDLAHFPAVRALAEEHAHLFASAGVHPDQPPEVVVDTDTLVRLADHPKVVAIGETGLDYYRLEGDLEWQRDRFRAHIRAARQTGKPLIVHTRSAAEDTIRIMREEGADRCGGVMHCFTETQAVADAALDLGFHISFSGIVTFKNAGDLREVARRVPTDRLLVETDAPYLAPVPHRGKTNEPGLVLHVAELIATIRGTTLAEIANLTTHNFRKLFSIKGDIVDV